MLSEQRYPKESSVQIFKIGNLDHLHRKGGQKYGRVYVYKVIRQKEGTLRNKPGDESDYEVKRRITVQESKK